MKKKGLRFWGYLDEEGQIHIKRYRNDREIANYEQMWFCKGIFDPFEALSLEHAKLIIREFCLQEVRK